MDWTLSMNEKQSSRVSLSEWKCRRLNFLHRKRGPVQTGLQKGWQLLQYANCVFAKTPYLQPTVEQATAEERRLGKQWGQMQRPPPPQDLISRQEHCNQEIKIQYRLDPDCLIQQLP